jgi:hypothetical protein
MKLDCENLDAFLAGALDAMAVAEFQEHARRCPACRDVIEQDRWLDSLLHSPYRLELETPPDSIIDSVRARLSRRRVARLAACGLAAAATVLIAVTCTVFYRQPIQPSPHDAAQTNDASSAPPVAPQATFVGGADVIVLPIASKSPDVTVVRIYPAYRSFANPADDKPSSHDLTPPPEFNGG